MEAYIVKGFRSAVGKAKKGGFAHDTGEGGISRYHREGGGDIIWELGSGYFGCRTSDGRFDSKSSGSRPKIHRSR